MNKCFDANNTELHGGDSVMYIKNESENEGIVMYLLSNNKIKFDGENGLITVNASDTYYLF